MVETELKFRVPAGRSAQLRSAVATATAQTTRLRAVYFDTPQRHLAQAGMALRLRLEGRRWVQTLKGSAGLMARAEHEVLLPAQRGEPALDPQLHAEAPVGQALLALLAGQGLTAGDLRVLYRTDVTRIHRLLRFQGALFELAYDRGHLLADGRRREVDELEIELKSGSPQALPLLAERWVTRFGLWWDPRTKSEMGTRLALDQAQVPARKVQAAWPGDGATPGALWTATLQSALLQALANAAECADGSGGPEHLHQLRVGLRRLRAALRLFSPWCAEPEAARALDDAWRAPFGALGAARDAEVQRQLLAPPLAAAGMPPLDGPPAVPAEELARLLQGAEVQRLLLRALALSLQPATPAPALRTAARGVLRGAWRSVRKDAGAFGTADVRVRHRLRKRLKRLRYGLESLLPLYPAGPSRRLQRAVEATLSALGELNDVEGALAALQAQVQPPARPPQAWFAIGWLSARRQDLLARAAASLQALEDAPRPWRRG